MMGSALVRTGDVEVAQARGAGSSRRVHRTKPLCWLVRPIVHAGLAAFAPVLPSC